MKKRFFMFSVLLAAATSLFAANELVVKPVTAPQKATVPINIELNNDKEYVGFTFFLNLPEGVTATSVSYSADRFAEAPTLPTDLTKKKLGFGYISGAMTAIQGTSGTLFTVNVTVDESVAVGTELTATLTEATFTTAALAEDELSDVSFKISVAEALPYDVLLDETSTTAPVAATGKTVLVKRSLVAGVNTICLPFAMTAAQLKAAFGDDVMLYDFTGYAYDDTKDEIKVSFDAVTALEANHPYVIQVSSAISEFTVEGVDIVPSDDPTNATVKRTKKAWSEMTGNYIAGTTVDASCLFLYNGNFYYSTGETKMKAFRAFFNFYDELEDKSVAASRARIAFDFTDDPTAIQGIARLGVNDGRIYSLRGQNMGEKMDKLPKGVYIVNGKKVVKK
jgi:hypothetical protein